MPLKLKHEQEKDDISIPKSTLNVFYIINRNIHKIHFIAAITIDDALDIYTKAVSNLKWKEKTREDYVRLDHWRAWQDHNRDKEYKKYLRELARERALFVNNIYKISGPIYIGAPCIIDIEPIKF